MIIFIWAYFESIVLIVNIHGYIKIVVAYCESFSTNIIFALYFYFSWNQKRKTV